MILKNNIPTGDALQKENDPPQMHEILSPLVSKSKKVALFFLRHFTGFCLDIKTVALDHAVHLLATIPIPKTVLVVCPEISI